MSTGVPVRAGGARDGVADRLLHDHRDARGDALQAALDVHTNSHQSKGGVLALAPEEGLGITDPEKRASLVEAVNRFRGV